MKNEIIRLAVIYPHLFPWRERITQAGYTFDIEEIQKTLRETKLNNDEFRRKTAWEVIKEIYKAALVAETVEEIVEVASSKVEIPNGKEAVQAIALGLAIRKDLNSVNKIKNYQDFIEGKLSKVDYGNKATLIYVWLVDLLTFYTLSNPNKKIDTLDNLLEQLEEYIKPLFYEDTYEKEKILQMLKKEGLKNPATMKIFTKYLSGSHGEYATLLQHIVNEEKTVSKEEFDLNEQLFDMLNEVNKSIENEVAQEERVENNEMQKETQEINIEEKMHEINSPEEADLDVEKLEKEKKASEEIKPEIIEVKQEEPQEDTLEAKKIFGEESGQVFAENGEIKEAEEKLNKVKEGLEQAVEALGCKMISKEAFNQLQKEEIGEAVVLPLIRKLVNPLEGAVLSQLYNMYRNIESMDKDNMKAILTEFFNTLMLLGIEVEENENRVGEKVEVNSKDALKEFILSTPVEKDGTIEGTMKYHAWKYEDRVIMPPVIQPNK